MGVLRGRKGDVQDRSAVCVPNMDVSWVDHRGAHLESGGAPARNGE